MRDGSGSGGADATVPAGRGSAAGLGHGEGERRDGSGSNGDGGAGGPGEEGGGEGRDGSGIGDWGPSMTLCVALATHCDAGTSSRAWPHAPSHSHPYNAITPRKRTQMNTRRGEVLSPWHPMLCWLRAMPCNISAPQ